MSINSIKNILDESKFNRFHLYLLLWCLFIISFEGYDLAVYGSVVPLITKEWGLSPIQAGVIGSYGLFGMMFGSIFLSLLADKFGQKKLLIVSVIAFSIFTTLSAFAPNAEFFAWCRFLAGIGFGGALPIVISLLTEYIPKSSKNKAITIALCGNQVGGILAPLMGILLISSLGWRSILWFAAIPLLLLPFIIKHIPESSHFLLKKGKLDVLETTLNKINANYNLSSIEESFKNEVNTKEAPIIRLFKNKLALSTTLFCVMYFMGLLMIYGLNTWLPNLMLNAGFPLSSGLSFAIFLNVGTIIGTVFWGIIADKKGSKKLLIILYSLGAIFLALIGIKGNIFLLYLLITATGFCLLSAHSLLNAFVSQYYPDDIRSTGVGFGNGIGRLGGVLGPTLGGILLATNSPATICFIVFALPGIFAALSLLLIKNNSKMNKTIANTQILNYETK